MAKDAPIARSDEGKAAFFMKRRDGVKQGVNRGTGKNGTQTFSRNATFLHAKNPRLRCTEKGRRAVITKFLITAMACILCVGAACGEALHELLEKRKAFDDAIIRRNFDLVDAKRNGDKKSEKSLLAQCENLRDERDLTTLKINQILFRKHKEAGRKLELGASIAALNTIEDAIATLEISIKVAKDEGMSKADIAKLQSNLADVQASRSSTFKRALWESIYLDSFEIMEKRYPQTRDTTSDFSKRLEVKLDACDEMALKDPRNLLRLATEVDKELTDEAIERASKGKKLLSPEEIRRRMKEAESKVVK
jgi:hypothetical protein